MTIMNTAERLLQKCKYNNTIDDYENLAVYLNKNRGTITDVSGIKLNKLLHTTAARETLVEIGAKYEEHIQKLTEIINQEKPSPAKAEELRQASKALAIGMNWNITFEEKDLAEFAKDAGNTPNVAVITQKLPAGLNISEVQKQAGCRLCLAGVDASECYMDTRDYAALPNAWKPEVSPILLKEREVVNPAMRIDSDMAAIAAATFSTLNPTEEQSAQLQTILSKRMVIDQETGMQAIVSILAELKKRGKSAISQMFEEANIIYQQFKGGDFHYKEKEQETGILL